MMDSVYINSLGWTLIHSIWQLTVLALVFFIVLMMLRDRKPKFRYWVSLLFMMVSVSVTSLTFILLFRKFSMTTGIQDLPAVPHSPAAFFIEQPEMATGLWSQVVHFFQSNVTSLTYMYMAGVVLLLMRMTFNLWQLGRLRRDSTPVDPARLSFFGQLIDSMQLPGNLLVRSSQRIDVPTVIGAFQPVVLIPASILSNTPPHLLKAIIAHELAHIERHDFLVNLVQTVVETLFFYHPAVWYFSYIARSERELSCDQRAVEAGCDPADLARALSEVGSLQGSQELSMSFRGQSNDLLNRVKYLLGFKPSFRYVPDQSVWYYGSLMGILLLLTLGKNQIFQKQVSPGEKLPAIYLTDTIPPELRRADSIVIIKRRDTVISMDESSDKKGWQPSGKTAWRMDTLIWVEDADTIPGKRKTIIVQSDGQMKVIIDGEETIVFDQEEMRKIQDSLGMIQFRLQESRSHFPDLDSLLSGLKGQHEGYARSLSFHRKHIDSLLSGLKGQHEGYARSLSFHREHLDSLRHDMNGIRSGMKPFEFYMSDSIRDWTFTIPPVPEINLDSLWDHVNLAQSIHHNFGLDTMMNTWDLDFSRVFSDSLDFYWVDPFVMNGKFSELQAKSKELQELSKEIEAKSRELEILRRAQREQYKKELRKMKEEKLDSGIDH